MKHHELKSWKGRHLLGVFLTVAFSFSAFAQSGARGELVTPGMSNETPRELADVGITEHLGTKINLDLRFKDESGADVPLRTYFADKKPVLLSLIYYSCPNLCNYHLNGMNDALKQMSQTAGKEFHLVAVSIDPKETPETAGAKKASYLKVYGRVGAENGWHFLTGEQSQIAELAKSVGFSYRWDEEKQQWAHAAAAYVVTPEGEISRYLKGIYFTPETVRLALAEANRGKIGNVIDSLILYCFHFDPSTNKYTLYAANVMRLVAGFAAVVLMIALIQFWFRQRREQKSLQGEVS